MALTADWSPPKWTPAWNPVGAAAFDQNGSATGQMGSLPTYSWNGYWYNIGLIDQLFLNPLDCALSFAAFVFGPATWQNINIATSQSVLINQDAGSANGRTCR